MQALRDIFSKWGTHSSGFPDFGAIAAALNEKQDTVYRWWQRGRIPERAWLPLISAAEARGERLTVADMHAANRPRKTREEAHKIKSKRRREERVAG
jgi:hypothetical protein